MKVPQEQKIRVRMEMLETIKEAWIQYISFFVLIFVIIYQVILGYAFRHNMMDSTVVSEVHTSKEQIFKLKTA
jgi:hypothetical protein